MTQSGQIKDFARNILGCACPEEVFERITVRRNPYMIKGLPVEHEICIGDRLLIQIVNSVQLTSPEVQLGEMMIRGKAERDERGFNRFRLVIASTDCAADQLACNRILTGLTGVDDKIHLHVIATEELPDF